jgi:hypothetical protein
VIGLSPAREEDKRDVDAAIPLRLDLAILVGLDSCTPLAMLDL